MSSLLPESGGYVPYSVGPRGAGRAQLAGPDFGLGCRGARPCQTLRKRCARARCMVHNLHVHVLLTAFLNLRVYVVMHLKQVEACRFHLVPQDHAF